MLESFGVVIQTVSTDAHENRYLGGVFSQRQSFSVVAIFDVQLF